MMVKKSKDVKEEPVDTDTLDKMVEKIKDVKWEINLMSNAVPDHLTFEFFIQVFEVSNIYTRRALAAERAQKILERREALRDNDMKTYE